MRRAHFLLATMTAALLGVAPAEAASCWNDVSPRCDGGYWQSISSDGHTYADWRTFGMIDGTTMAYGHGPNYEADFRFYDPHSLAITLSVKERVDSVTLIVGTHSIDIAPDPGSSPYYATKIFGGVITGQGAKDFVASMVSAPAGILRVPGHPDQYFDLAGFKDALRDAYAHRHPSSRDIPEPAATISITTISAQEDPATLKAASDLLLQQPHLDVTESSKVSWPPQGYRADSSAVQAVTSTSALPAPAPVASSPVATIRASIARHVGEGVGIVLLLLGAACVFFYFLPIAVATGRRVDKKGLIIFTNILFGWTIIGWLAALIMACTFETRDFYSQRRR